jgi:hypothetical protein
MVISTPTCFGTRLFIFSESTKTNDWRLGLVFLCFSRLPEDGSPVPKHVGVFTYHVLYFKPYLTGF